MIRIYSRIWKPEIISKKYGINEWTTGYIVAVVVTFNDAATIDLYY